MMNIRAKFRTISLKTVAFIKDLEGSPFFWSLGITRPTEKESGRYASGEDRTPNPCVPEGTSYRLNHAG